MGPGFWNYIYTVLVCCGYAVIKKMLFYSIWVFHLCHPGLFVGWFICLFVTRVTQNLVGGWGMGRGRTHEQRALEKCRSHKCVKSQ